MDEITEHIDEILLEAAASRATSPQEDEHIRQHMADCPVCLSRMEMLRQEHRILKSALNATEPFVNSEKDQRIARAVLRDLSFARTQQKPSWEDRILRSRVFWGAVAASILVGILLPGLGAPFDGGGIESGAPSKAALADLERKRRIQEWESVLGECMPRRDGFPVFIHIGARARKTKGSDIQNFMETRKWLEDNS